MDGVRQKVEIGLSVFNLVKMPSGVLINLVNGMATVSYLLETTNLKLLFRSGQK